MALDNDQRHGWDGKTLRRLRIDAIIFRKQSKPRQKRGDPNAKLRFAIGP